MIKMVSTLIIDKEAIAETCLDPFVEYIEWNPQYKNFMLEVPGKEAYRLLANLSAQIVKVNPIPLMCDVGTLFGASALVMAVTPSVQVLTYDIQNYVPANVKSIASISNIKRHFFSAQLDIDTIAKADLVLVDIDPHGGAEEAKFLDMLKARDFKGIVIFDDIYLNDKMKHFWQNIKETKWDVTEYAHCTGTGIVVFPGSKYVIEIK